jgi:hypothetical protein
MTVVVNRGKESWHGLAAGEYEIKSSHA